MKAPPASASTARAVAVQAALEAARAKAATPPQPKPSARVQEDVARQEEEDDDMVLVEEMDAMQVGKEANRSPRKRAGMLRSFVRRYQGVIGS